MKLLLDACVPRPLRKFLPDHSVHTAQEMGWGQLRNGALLRAAEIQFEVFITTDQNRPEPEISAEGRWKKAGNPGPANERLANASTLRPGDFVELRWLNPQWELLADS